MRVQMKKTCSGGVRPRGLHHGNVTMRIIRALFGRLSYWYSRLGIRGRLVAYLIIGLLPILGSTIYSFEQITHARERQVLLGHMATAQATAGAVREFLQGIVQSQEVVGVAIARQNYSYEEMNAFFASVLQVSPFLETLGFALPSGEIVAGYPTGLVGLNIADREYFRRVVAGQEWTVSDLLVSRLDGRSVFVVAHRADHRGRFEGVIISSVSPQVLGQFVTRRAAPDVGYGILDSTGRIIITTVLSHEAASREPDRSWIPSVRTALTGEPAFAEPFRDRADGVRRMGASVPVTGVGWVVNVFEPVSSAMAPVRRAGFLDIIVEVSMALLLILLAWILGARLAEPLRVLVHKAEAIGQGDFSQRVEPPDRAEMGALATAFNDMASRLEYLSAEEREARELASFLADIGEMLTSTLDRRVALQSVAERTAAFMGDVVAVGMLQPDGTLVPIAISSSDPTVAERLRELSETQSAEAWSSLAAEAVERGQTIFVPLVADIENAEKRRHLEQIGAISSLAVPMMVHGETIGVLSISSTRAPLRQNDVPVAEDLARRLGVALENMNLYAETLEREKFQRSLADLASAVSSTLDPEAILSTVCERTRAVFGTDGVYIWVLEEDEDRLVGTSACGFRANEFVGLSLPLSATDTYAIKALERRQGFYVSDMDQTVATGRLATTRFQSRSAVFQPLISAGTPLGVMVISDAHNPHRFDDRSVKMAEVLAGYAAQALSNARAYVRERRIAETLQRSLLSDLPARIDGFEMSHFYTPARQEAAIGGDFYDFLDVGGGLCALVVGDVSGKGLDAAVTTALVKYLIWAYAAEDSQPGVVLERVNNAIARYTEPELFVTLVYGLLDARHASFRYGNAGHEPILVYRANERSVEYQARIPGMAAGLQMGQEYLTGEITLAPGDMMLMYTDGLTDARSPHGEFLGQDGLERLVLESVGGSAGDFLSGLMDRVKRFSGGEFGDDVAVLVVRRPPA